MATLKTFEEGDTIYASETNANNQALLSLLTDNAVQVQKYVEGEVASIKSNVASVQQTLQNNINEALEVAESKIAADLKNTTNGFCQLSNGLLFQWGRSGHLNAFSGTTVTFPKAFSAEPIVVTSCKVTTGNVSEVTTHLGGVSKTSFYVCVDRRDGSGTDGGPVNWIAIGFGEVSNG